MTSATSQPGSVQFTPPPHRRFRLVWIVLLVVATIVILCLFLMRNGFGKSEKTAATTPTVAVVEVDRENLYNVVTIPAEFRPYVEADLHAKVSGFMTNISVDFGDKVKAGQVLAMLEVPELKDELDSAYAAEQRAQADYTNAHLMYSRLEGVNQQHPNLVAEQDIDTAETKYSVSLGALTSAKADVEKYQTLFGYTKIIAPFDGVITRRYVDPGALIQSGTSSDVQASAVMRLSDNYHLRLDFPVSVEYVRDMRLGSLVSVRVDSLGGKSFTGKITRFADDVNLETRTMVTEMEVDNPSLEIVPGMYASVMLKVQQRTNVLAIPTQAVSTGQESTVDVVDPDDKIEERNVTVGLETPDRYEVLSGLKEGDKVVIGTRSEVSAGQKVEPKIIVPPSGEIAPPKRENL